MLIPITTGPAQDTDRTEIESSLRLLRAVLEGCAAHSSRVCRFTCHIGAWGISLPTLFRFAPFPLTPLPLACSYWAMVRSSDHVVERLTTALPVFDEYGSLVSPLGTVREHSRVPREY